MLIYDLPNFIITKICLELKEKEDLVFLGRTCKVFYEIIFKQDPYAKIIWRPHQAQCLTALQYDIRILKELGVKINFSTTEAAVTDIIELIKFTKIWRKYTGLGLTFRCRNKKTFTFLSNTFSKFVKKSIPPICKWIKKEKLLEIELLEDDGNRFSEIIISKNNEKLFQEIKKKPIENLCFKVGSRYKTLLLMSVESKNLGAVNFLIKNSKGDINFCNGYATPLMIAVYHNDEDTMGLLLGCQKLDVNLRTKLGYTALHIAVIWGYKGMVELLLRAKKIDINVRGGEGISCLILAICRKALSIVKILVADKELDVNLTDIYGRTAIFYAVETGNVELVQLILGHKNIDIEIKDSAGETVLMYLFKRVLTEPHLQDVLSLFFEFYKKKFSLLKK